MGFITDEQLQHNKIQYAGIDQESGKFESNGSLFPAISGKLMGFGDHVFDFKNQPIKKFDIFIKDGEALIQINIGFYSWQTFKLMNSLLNIPNIKSKGEIMIKASKKDANYNIGLEFNGEWIKWKYSFDDLKFNGKEGDAKTAHRNKIIDKWFITLSELLPYTKDEPVPAEVPAGTVDDEELLF